MNNETGGHDNKPQRTPSRTKQIIDVMALAGEKVFYDDCPKDLDDALIESDIWSRVSLAMLQSIEFPAELYRICHEIACMSDEKLEEMFKEQR